jgi:DNA-binding response OmpR family regulator
MKFPTPRILFVEDHDDTRELVALILRESQYSVTTAATIDETLKLARRSQFNLFILDSWLLDGSGIDLCKQIRKFDDCTPILFYSGAAYEKDKSLAISSGAQAYLVKPVEVPELLQAVESLIKNDFKSISESGEDKANNDGLPRQLARAARLL